MHKLAIEGGDKSIAQNEIPIDEQPYAQRDLDLIKEVLESKRYSLFNNDTISKLEEKIAGYFGTEKCLMFTNCTSALDASFRSLNSGSGNEVIMPSYTYAATMMAILSSGAKPVFVDIDYKTLTLDINLLEEKINSRTKAIVPVHIFGNPCNMNEILCISNKYGLRVIEDCAHAFGASYEGKKVGSFDIGCHSFGENKILRIGEGGAVTSNDNKFMNSVEIIRHEGEVWSRMGISAARGIDLKVLDLLKGIDYVKKGHNFRPSPLLAALGISRLETIDEQIETMSKNAQIYTKLFEDISEIQIPKENKNANRIHSSYITLLDEECPFNRDALFVALAMEGVPIGVHFPTPLHKTTIYNSFSTDFYFPNAERFCKNHIALPIYPSLSEDHIMKIGEVVVDTIKRINENPHRINQKAEDMKSSIPIKHFYSGMYITI